MDKKLKVLTVGVYGSTEEQFFKKLVDANVEIFCDIRLRRGMRGSKYAFANSTYLQEKLSKLGIRYMHIKELAPSQEIRQLQKEVDERQGATKKSRNVLSEEFKGLYNEKVVNKFDFDQFVHEVLTEVGNVAFFCVEENPSACHRSLVAKKLGEFGVELEDL
jgi:uncharacterized protein (DUF488 family)